MPNDSGQRTPSDLTTGPTTGLTSGLTTGLEVMILSYDSAVVIEACLASLAAVLPGVGVAIREHSDDPAAIGRLERLAARHPAPVRISADPGNPGFGAGCNAMAATSTARHYLFLNPDTELVAWPFHDALPEAGRITGPVMVDSGDPARHWGIDYRIRDEVARSWLRRSAPMPAGTGFVSGAALLVAAEDFERLGGFDESFFLFYEDIDLCLRANASGIGTWVVPAFTVRHAGAHSTSGRFGQSLIWSYESAVRFHRKHGSPVVGYRTYVVADSIGRATGHLLLGHRERARSYGRLARRAATDLAGRASPR